MVVRYLIDTHVYLWWLSAPEQLQKPAFAAIEALDNAVFVSAAVPWELTIKSMKGKLQIGKDVMSHMESDGMLPLDISHNHVLATRKLPPLHNDPFDRIQIAQALTEHLILITRDQQILQYDVIKTMRA
jgi:PIN domain nuclease of toxin-antitoxin system